MIKPNFFIVGAPKCGTTALSNYLGEHPNIFISPIKEPNYFANDFREGNLEPGGTPVGDLKTYLELFQGVEETHQAIGEASATYLASAVAPSNIYQFNPQAKIVVMLRNPVDLAYSFHSQIVFNLGENEPDFAKAWELQESRQQGKNIPPLCGNTNVLQYRQIAQIGSQLEKLLEVFPREQVKVILLDDFKKNTPSVYKEVINFLGLPPYEKQDFAILNQNKTYKSALIARLSQKPPKIVGMMIKTIKALLKTEQLGIASKLKQFNSKEQARIPLSEEFRKELVTEFTSEVVKLEEILSLDLSEWKN